MAIKLGNNDITFKVGSTDVDAIYLGSTLVYSGGTPPTPSYDTEYLTFVATESGTFSFSRASTASANTLQYSTDDGTTWTEGSAVTVSSGDTVLWKGTMTSLYEGIGTFSSTSTFTVEGNVMSLLYGDNFIGQTSLSEKYYVFSYLFGNCTHLTSAENMILPATTLAENCYDTMFRGCTSLTTAPELPATTLADNCYSGMFYGCTSLTTAPQLSATTLASNCYQNMFSGCTSLTTAPTLLATTLATSCYQAMFRGCTSLTTAPQLLATTLASRCYYNMFNGCSSLTSITCLATDISASNCTINWVNGVAANGTFTKAASMSSWIQGSNGIPIGWTVQNYAG